MGRRIPLAVVATLLEGRLSFAQSGTALHFTQTPTYVTVADSPTLQLGSHFTVEMWVKPDDFGGHLLAKPVGDAASDSYSLWFRTEHDVLHLAWGISSSFVQIENPLTIGQWTHIAGIRGSFRGLQLYIDGRLVGTGGNGSVQYDNHPVLIGADEDHLLMLPGATFPGTIDEVRIWNTARTAQQIQQTMHLSLPAGSVGGLVANWTFNEGQGQVTLDLSGHGNHGILGMNPAASGDPADPQWVDSPFNCADAYSDHLVDINDLLFVIDFWGPCSGPPGACDAADVFPTPIGDGQVNVDDLLAVIADWGPCS